MERAGLALAAGEQERARQLAELVTLWLRRAARQLDRESHMLLTWRAFAGAMHGRAIALERARTDPELPPAAARRLASSLDAARRALAPAPSPITLARSLASFFFSVRFALALAVALLIQGWRFYDQRPFGIRRRDYLEAFALGVGVQGLVEGLSATLAQLAAGG